MKDECRQILAEYFPDLGTKQFNRLWRLVSASCSSLPTSQSAIALIPAFGIRDQDGNDPIPVIMICIELERRDAGGATQEQLLKYAQSLAEQLRLPEGLRLRIVSGLSTASTLASGTSSSANGRQHRFRAWVRDSRSNLNAEPLAKEEVNFYLGRKADYDLFLIGRTRRIVVHFKQGKMTSVGLQASLLKHLLKNDGYGGSAWELALHLYRSEAVIRKIIADSITPEVSDKEDYENKVRAVMKRLNTKLGSKGLHISGEDHQGYALPDDISYCLIEPEDNEENLRGKSLNNSANR